MATTTDDLIRLLLRRWRVLFLAIVIGGAIGLGLAATRSTSYSATAILLGHSTAGDRTPSELVSASGKVFQHSAVDPDVAGVAVHDAQLPVNPNELGSVITATPSADSPLLAISAKNANPAVAQKLANTVAGAVSNYSHSLASQNGYQMDKLSDASKPTSPSGPGKVLFVVAGIALAFLLAVFLIIVRNTPDDEDEDEEDDAPDLRAAAPAAKRRKPAAVKATPTPRPAGTPGPRPSSPRWKGGDELPDQIAQGES